MSKIMYKAQYWYKAEVTAFEVIKETEKTVLFIDTTFSTNCERKEHKESEGQKWFHDWESAQEWLIQQLEAKIEEQDCPGTDPRTARRRVDAGEYPGLRMVKMGRLYYVENDSTAKEIFKRRGW